MNDRQIEPSTGSAPGPLILKLVLLSLLVGVVLAVFDLTPWRLFHTLRYLFEELVGSGMEAVHRLLGYLASGAIIVVPIWLLIRLFSTRRG